MRVDVARGDRRDAQSLGKLVQLRVARHVASLVRALQLDVERTVEGARELRGAVRIDDSEPVARAAGERDEPFRVLLEHVECRLRRQQVALLSGYACAC